ncbi:MAG: hypothetical protein QW685_06500 [Saccharolobus sp.]
MKVFGKKSHGGLPQLGIDAIKMINKLYDLVPELTSSYSRSSKETIYINRYVKVRKLDEYSGRLL